MFDYLVTLSGVGFYPSRLTFGSKINITSLRDTGEVSKTGKKVESGYICIDGKNIKELHGIALEIKSGVPEINEIEFSVIRYCVDQCNLEFSTDELRLITDLNAYLSISCSMEEPDQIGRMESDTE